MDGGRSIRGAGGGGEEKQHTPVEAPDSLHSVAYARIDDLTSEGPIRGLVNGLASIYFNETPLANADGSLNFRNVQVDWRSGTQTQSPIPGFDTVENEIAVGLELKLTQPWTQALNNTAIDGIRVRISTPQLTAGSTNGDVTGSTVDYAVDISTDGGPYQTVLTSAITGKTTSKYERSHRFDLPHALDGWVIRVRRLTADSSSALLANDTYIESFTELVDAKLRYPNSAHCATVIDAAQFQSIPTRSFDCYGFDAVPVPTNYNPETRVYTGIWDGTFKPAYTNNPAWAFNLLVTHKRFGLGHLVDQSQVSKWALYRIAKWCDELVPDGFGGMEPRLTCNLYIQSQEDAYKVLQDMASIFRGVAYWAGGSILASADMPTDPTYVYTPANVLGGKFEYAGSGKRARHTVALVSWNDMENFCRPKVEYIEDLDGISRYGVNQTEVMAIGCTSRGQARRMGKMILTTERLETDLVTFSVGLDGTLCAPGQVVPVADPLRAGRRMGGRLSSATNVSIVVDRLPDPLPPVGSTLNVIGSDGLLVARSISAIDPGLRLITVSAPFATNPTPQSVWAIDAPDLSTVLYRVISVTEDQDLTYTVTGLRHEPDKYDYVDFNDPIEPRVPVPTPVSEEVAAVTLSQFNRTTEFSSETVVAADWQAPGKAQKYDVQWRKDDGNWTPTVRQAETSSELPKAYPGDYLCRVSAVSANGRVTAPTYSDVLTIADAQAPPGFVEDLTTGLEVLEQIGLENQQDIAQEILDRIAADAQVALAAATATAGEAADRAAAIGAEANARATAILNEQLTRQAAIQAEQTIRQGADESLAQSISTLSAGTGEQFDSRRVFYFDADLEAWTGNGVPTVANGFLRPANAGSDPYVQSPTGLAIDGAAYKYVKARINKTGNPVWVGTVSGYSAGGAVLATQTLPAPAFQADGDATIDFKDIAWAGTVDRIRLNLFAAQTASDYVRIDWVAIGRPTPGASVAALQDEQTARVTADSANATATSTLAAQMRGGYAGTDVNALSTGLVYSERVARVTADSANASAVTALDTRLTSAEGVNTAQGTSISGLSTRVTSAENVNTSQGNALTSLDSRVTGVESTNTTQATALTSLDTRVTATETTNTSQATALTSLGSRVTSAEGINTGQAGAITALDTRVTATETTTTQQATQITNLAAGIQAVATVTNGSFEYEGDWNNWSPASGYSRVVSANSRAGASYLTHSAIAADSAGTARDSANTNFPVVGGRTYRFGGYVRVFGAVTGASYGYVLVFYDAAGSLLAGSGVSTRDYAGVHGWELQEALIEAPAGAAAANIRTRAVGHNTGATVGFDDVHVVLVDQLVTDTATATTALTARVTAAEGNITSTASDLTALTTNVGTKASAVALTSLEARVTSTEGVNTSQATSITGLSAGVNAAAASITTLNLVTASGSSGNVVPNPSFETADLWTYNANAGTNVYAAARTGTQVLRLNGGSPAPLATSGYTFDVKTGQTIRLGFWYRTIGTAPTDGVARLNIRYYDASGASISYAATNCSVSYNTLSSVWKQALGSETPPAGAVKGLIYITSNSNSGSWAIDDLSVETLSDMDSVAFASAGVTLDVNGYVTGYKQSNNGATGVFGIVADKFQIVSPAGGARTEYSNGNWRVYDSAGQLRVQMGIWP